MGGSVTSTTLTQVLCSLLFPPPERGCRQHQRTQTLDPRTERLNSETDSSTPTVVHEAKRLQTSKLWRSFWTGVISPLGYPSDVPFRIRTYDSAAYKPLVSFVIRTTCLGGSWDRWILLLHGGNWAHILRLSPTIQSIKVVFSNDEDRRSPNSNIASLACYIGD